MSGCSQIEAIGKAAFWNCSNLKKIKIGTEIPPVLVDNPFQGAGSGYSSIKIIVPAGCVDAYETVWRNSRFYISDYDF